MNKVDEIFDEQGNLIRRRVRFYTDGPSMTKQAMKDECDINNIMLQFERTGLIAHQASREAYFADVSEVPDFAKAVEVVRNADLMFMSLPASLRAQFDNDAAKYVEFCANPANAAKMVELGLIVKPVPVAPLEVKVVNPLPEVKPNA